MRNKTTEDVQKSQHKSINEHVKDWGGQWMDRESARAQ